MKKYTNRIVFLHWLTVILLITAIILGNLASDAREEGNATLATYLVHFLVGNLILILTLVRLFFKYKDGSPAPMGKGILDKFAKLVHYSIYIVLISLAVSGIATVKTSQISVALSADDVTLLPTTLDNILPYHAHMILLNILIGLVALHVLGAIKHQFINKDHIMDRMSFKNK